MPNLTKRIYEQFEMNMNGTPVKFLAIQYSKTDPVCGPFRIKFQTWGEGATDWSKVYDANFDLTLEQWQHFKHDINPTAPLHYYLRQTPTAELVQLSSQLYSTVRGESAHLGRGNSWNGYRFGPNVVKLSSIVPYVWQNSHAYLTVGESAAQAWNEIGIIQAFMAHPKLSDRVAHIIRVEQVGQKLAVTMPYMEPVALGTLTPDQAYYLEETIHRMHRLGYAYLDQEIGFGLDPFGTPRIYDLSTVRHRSETRTKQGWSQWIEDDLDTLRRLREMHGLTQSKTQAKVRAIQRKRHDKIKEAIKSKS
jgi:hypothetical protein